VKKLIAVAVALFVGAALTVAGTANAGGHTRVKPTIVFVHGAFADASGFGFGFGFGFGISSLQKQGYTVLAPPNPLRSLSGDAASKALVYIAAYALDEGESVAAANQLGGGHTDIEAELDFRPYPGAPPLAQSPTGYDLDAYIKQSSFRALFAADVPAAEAAVMAAAQRPGTLLTLGEPSGVPAWRTIPSWYLVARPSWYLVARPSWYLVASNDKTIPPEAERAMAARAESHTVELATSHAAILRP
jgi:pimeloyl-ACP methyl ester carboxylesterase